MKILKAIVLGRTRHAFLLCIVCFLNVMMSQITAAQQPDYLISVKVFLNDQQVDVGYTSGLDGLSVSGNCFWGDVWVSDSAGVSNGVLHVEACSGDSLYFTISPTHYAPDATLLCWEIDGHCVEDEESYTHYPFQNESISVKLESNHERHPVGSRWAPEAGRRSGREALWGPAYLAAKLDRATPGASEYPALLYSGESFEKQVDLFVPGRGLDFVFARIHRSGDTAVRDYFGAAWTHNFDIYVESDVGFTVKAAKVSLGNGLETYFLEKYRADSKRYYYAEGWDAQLIMEANGAGSYFFRLRFGDGLLWTFESFSLDQSAGAMELSYLDRITDRFGNEINLSWSTDGEHRLLSLTDTLNRSYSFTYNADGTLASLSEEDGLERSISYGYASGALASVSYPESRSIAYAYDAQGRLETVRDAKNKIAISHVYDEDGRLSSQSFGEGAEAGTVSLNYASGFSLMEEESHGVAVEDCAGRQREYYFNDRNQLLRRVAHDGEESFSTAITWEEHYFYSTNGVFDGLRSDDIPLQVTLADGRVIDYVYQGPGVETAVDADYALRMNLVQSQVNARDSSARALRSCYQHALSDYWDARFGPSFCTRQEVIGVDGRANTAAEREALFFACDYIYSEEGLATLDYINYEGLPSYASAATAAAPESGLLGAGLDQLATADAVYGANALRGLVHLTSPLLEAATAAYDTNSVLLGGDILLLSADAESSTSYHEAFSYNAWGQRTERLHPDTDGLRRRDSYGYSGGYLSSLVIDADGEALTTSYQRDEVGRIEAITDPALQLSDLVYDDLDLLDYVDAPAADSATLPRQRTDYSYDANANVCAIAQDYFDEQGNDLAGGTLDTELDYDSRNRFIEVRREDVSGEWNRSQWAYDGNGRVLLEKSPLAVSGDEPDNCIRSIYDGRGLLKELQRADALSTQYQYDAAGRLILVAEGYGDVEVRVSRYTYDGLGYPTESTAPDGAVQRYERDQLGRSLRMQVLDGDAVLAEVGQSYDLMGRLDTRYTLHRDENGNLVGDGLIEEVYTYTDSGRLLSYAVEGDTAVYGFDSVGRVDELSSPSGDTQFHFDYDAKGNLTERKESARSSSAPIETQEYITRFRYDALNRLIERDEDDGDADTSDARTTHYVYDSLGQLRESSDARDKVTQYRYDPLGRLTQEIHDPAGIDARLEFEYDANHRVVSQTDPLSHVTQYAYDSRNRCVQTSYPDGSQENRAYNIFGEVIRATDPGGRLSVAQYDACGRLLKQSFEQLGGRWDTGPNSYEYDPLGRLVRMSTADTVVEREYDTLGNLCLERCCAGGLQALEIAKDYDHRGRLCRLTPSLGAPVSYQHDADSRVDEVGLQGEILQQIRYLGMRPSEENHFHNGNLVASTSLDYEESGKRLADIRQYGGDNALLDARSYAWDEAYNLASQQITDGPLAGTAQTFQYDALNRLDPNSLGATWTLDAAGNRNGTAYQRTGSDALMNRYTQAENSACYYDATGALYQVAENGACFSYNADGRPVEYWERVAPSMNALDLSDPAGSAWRSLAGTWEYNDAGSSGDPSDDYLEESSEEIGGILRALPAAAQVLSVDYASGHDPDSGDFGSFYYALFLISVDRSDEGNPDPDDFPYVAVRIEPDRLSLIAYDGESIQELDQLEVDSEADVWYRLRIVLKTEELRVERLALLEGRPISVLSADSDLVGATTNNIGFRVGGESEFVFQNAAYATDSDTKNAHIGWSYDALGRKLGEGVFNASGTQVSLSTFLYDGWRMLAEVAFNPAKTPRLRAQYIPGPNGLDQVIAIRRDLDENGMASDGSETFHLLTNHQRSTVLSVDGAGSVRERYTYSPFGAPNFYDASGSAISGSAIKNSRLYTGRRWLPRLHRYDYRNRLYDPATGRFTSPDPLGPYGDWNNLGNAYSYVGNNPGAFSDPFGLQAQEEIGGILNNGRTVRAGDIFLQDVVSERNPLANDTRVLAEAIAAFYGGILKRNFISNPASAAQQQLSVLGTIAREEAIGSVFVGAGAGVLRDAGAGVVKRLRGAVLRSTENGAPSLSNVLFRKGSGEIVDKNQNPVTGRLRYGKHERDIKEGVCVRIISEPIPRSYRLRENLIDANLIPKADEVAHHIVPHGHSHRFADLSRKILRNYGIGIDDAENGVFLIDGFHRGVHTKPYLRELYLSLSLAKTKEEVIGILTTKRLQLRKVGVK